MPNPHPPSVRAIVARFGRIGNFATAVGVPYKRAAAWIYDVKEIPGGYHDAVLRAADQLGVDVTREELDVLSALKRRVA